MSKITKGHFECRMSTGFDEWLPTILVDNRGLCCTTPLFRN